MLILCNPYYITSRAAVDTARPDSSNFDSLGSDLAPNKLPIFQVSDFGFITENLELIIRQ